MNLRCMTIKNSLWGPNWKACEISETNFYDEWLFDSNNNGCSIERLSTYWKK